jgi:hypothetical protein
MTIDHDTHDIASALLAVRWTEWSLTRRLKRLFGHGQPKTRGRLVAELLAAGKPYPPSPRRLSAQLRYNRSFLRLLAKRQPPRVTTLDPPRFAPAAGLGGLGVPVLETPGALAAWLDLPLPRLDWLADQRRQHGATAIPVLQNYTFRFIAKRSGVRLIEAPKTELRAAQTKILREILDRLPPHPAAHGFAPGRSCRTGAALHAGERVVACLDLEDFFAATPLRPVHALFWSLGYPYAVARLLTGLCTTATPRNVLARMVAAGAERRRSIQRFSGLHLPQGAPTSPALANLCAYRLDVRLSGLAARFEARFTRYADDLTFSGDLARAMPRLLARVATIVQDEGYQLNAAKTRVMHASRHHSISMRRATTTTSSKPSCIAAPATAPPPRTATPIRISAPISKAASAGWRASTRIAG